MRSSFALVLLLAAASGCAIDDDGGELDELEADCGYAKTTTALNVRERPDTRSRSVMPGGAMLGVGEIVKLVTSQPTVADPSDPGYQGAWRKVKVSSQYDSVEGYAAADFLIGTCLGDEVAIPDSCGEGEAMLGYVRGTYPTLNLRSDPSIPATDYFANVVDMIPEGAPIHLLGEKTTIDYTWYRVEVPDYSVSPPVARTGWVASPYVVVADGCKPWGLERPARFAHRWGSATYSSWSDTARIANMTAAAARLDGQIVAAGARLSYLDHILDDAQAIYDAECPGGACGECPAELVLDETGRCNLFREGHSTSGGAIFGGGVCGTASAMHRATMQAGLPIAKWQAHSRFWDLYGYKGEDAQVAWGESGFHNQDYELVNDTGGELRVMTRAHVDPKTKMTEVVVELWGERPVDRTVTIERPCRNADGSNATSCSAVSTYGVTRTVVRASGGVSGVVPFVNGNGAVVRSSTTLDGKTAERWTFRSTY